MNQSKAKTLQLLRLAWKLASRTSYLYKMPECMLNPSFLIYDDSKLQLSIIDENGNAWLDMVIDLDGENPIDELQQKIRSLGCCFKLTGRELTQKRPCFYTPEVVDSIVEEIASFCKNFYFSIESVKDGMYL